MLPEGEGQGEGEHELYKVTLSTCPNQSLIGTQQVAWLHFTAISNQSSAFVPLLLDNTVGRQPDGTEVRNFAPQAGRVVVVGEEPLLEAILATNRQPALILYGLPGPGYVIEGKPRWDTSLPWQAVWEGAQTNLFHQIQPIGGTNRMMFFRARRGAAAGTGLEIVLGTGHLPSLVLHGQPGVGYRVESKTTLDSAMPWQSAWEGVLNGTQQVIAANVTNQSRFFRVLRQ